MGFPFDPISTIMAGANLVSGIYQQREAEQMANRQMHEQRVFAQNGIQWKVADAVAAGVHPLFAMGAMSPNYTPVAIQDTGFADSMSRAVQHMADGYRPEEYEVVNGKRIPTPGSGKSLAEYNRQNARRAAKMARKRMDAEADLIDLQVEAARLQLNELRRTRDKQDSIIGNDDADRAKFKPWTYATNEVASPNPGKPHITAGPDTPAWTRFRIGPKISMIAPGGSSFSEALESLEGVTPKLFVIAANMAEFGPGWLDQVAKELNWSSAKKKQVYEQVIPFLVP